MSGQIDVIENFDLPKVHLKRLIWQPVTDRGVTKMRLAPLDWQGSGSHHALEYLAAEIERLTADNAKLQALSSDGETITHLISQRDAALARVETLKVAALPFASLIIKSGRLVTTHNISQSIINLRYAMAEQMETNND